MIDPLTGAVEAVVEAELKRRQIGTNRGQIRRGKLGKEGIPAALLRANHSNPSDLGPPAIGVPKKQVSGARRVPFPTHYIWNRFVILTVISLPRTQGPLIVRSSDRVMAR